MAFCRSCGAELTGIYCAQCGEPSGGVSRTRQQSSKSVLKWVLISLGTLVGLLVLAAIIVPLTTMLPGLGGSNEQPFTTVVAMAKNHEIREIVVDGKKLTVIPRVSSRTGSDRFTSRIGEGTDIVTLLVENGVEIGPPGRVEVTFKGSSGWTRFFGCRGV